MAFLFRTLSPRSLPLLTSLIGSPMTLAMKRNTLTRQNQVVFTLPGLYAWTSGLESWSGMR